MSAAEGAAPIARSPARARIINLVLVVVAIGLLALTVRQHRAEIREVLDRPLDGRAIGLLAAAFGIYMLALVSTFMRWYILVRAQGLPFRVRDALRLGFIGNVFNLVIPGAVGGDFIKAAFLYKEHARKTQAIGSMVIDRAVGLIGLFVLAAVMGATIWSDAPVAVRRLIAIAAAGAIAGGFALALLFTPALYRPVRRLVAGRQRLESILVEMVDMAAAYRGRLGTVLLMLLMATAIHALYVFAFYLVSCALFPTDLPTLSQHFLIVPLVLFTTAVPMPFGAIGVSEFVSAELFQFVHYPGGAVAMMAYRFLLMYTGGLVSVVVYLANLRQVRTLSKEADSPDLTGPT